MLPEREVLEGQSVAQGELGAEKPGQWSDETTHGWTSLLPLGIASIYPQMGSPRRTGARPIGP